MTIHNAAQGFDRAAEEYERGRASYPPDAIAYLAEALRIREGVTVVDLAAGTGKLTRMLIPTGAHILAVEPVEGMRRKLAVTVPGVPIVGGTAEALPFAAEMAGGVVVGQAFHWFRGDAALAEIHRILGPGGRLGLIWNVRDVSVDWVRGLSEIIAPYQGDAPRAAAGQWRRAFAESALFTPLTERHFRHEQPVTVETIQDRIASTSFIAAQPEEERAAILEQVRQLIRSHPQTRGREHFLLPYRTDVFWCAKISP